MGLIIWLIVGAAAGYLAGQIMKGKDFGLLKNMLIGIAGSFVGGIIFSILGLGTYGIIADIIAATAGAMLLLWGIPKLSK